MSWKIFLSPKTPPLVDPDQMNLHALSRQRSSRRKAEQLKTQSQANRSRLSSISRMLLRDPPSPAKLQTTSATTTALTQINQTLKQMKLLVVQGNSTLHRFLQLMEKNITLKTTAKSLAKTSRDQKSTVKKRGKLGSRFEEKISVKLAQFEKVKKGYQKRGTTASKKSK